MNDETRRVTAAELRTLTTIASSPTLATHDVENMRPVLGRVFSELVFLRAQNTVLTKTAADVDQIRADLAERLGLDLDEIIGKRRRGPNGARSTRLGIAAELLRRRGIQREVIGMILNYRRTGVDHLLENCSKRIRQSPAFAAYVESLCK